MLALRSVVGSNLISSQSIASTWMFVFLLCVCIADHHALDTNNYHSYRPLGCVVLVPALLMIPICKIFKLNFKVWAPPHVPQQWQPRHSLLFTYTFARQGSCGIAICGIGVCAIIITSVGLALLSEGNPIKQILKMPIFLAAALAMTLNLSGIAELTCEANIAAWARPCLSSVVVVLDRKWST